MINTCEHIFCNKRHFTAHFHSFHEEKEERSSFLWRKVAQGPLFSYCKGQWGKNQEKMLAGVSCYGCSGRLACRISSTLSIHAAASLIFAAILPRLVLSWRLGRVTLKPPPRASKSFPLSLFQFRRAPVLSADILEEGKIRIQFPRSVQKGKNTAAISRHVADIADMGIPAVLKAFKAHSVEFSAFYALSPGAEGFRAKTEPVRFYGEQPGHSNNNVPVDLRQIHCALLFTDKQPALAGIGRCLLFIDCLLCGNPFRLRFITQK